MSAVVETESLARARNALDQVSSAPRRKSIASMADARDAFPHMFKAPRRKPPRQLCPVPGCKNTAAPVYGMVCGDHRKVPKSKIVKYRKARRAAAEKTKR